MDNLPSNSRTLMDVRAYPLQEHLQWYDQPLDWTQKWHDVIVLGESTNLQHHDGCIRAWSKRGQYRLLSYIQHRHIGQLSQVIGQYDSECY
ncbi:hypothetical protein TNCV_3771491 [Trichonephila clavipes]|nr:hypothetical protein TNCV_3771491 [Trichonephila clavipes]